jgi:hypothetical protein
LVARWRAVHAGCLRRFAPSINVQLRFILFRRLAAATAVQAEFNAQQAVCIFRGIYFTDGGPANEM